MQFGAMDFPVVPVLDEIETFSRLGFDYLELAMDPPMAHHRLLAAARKAIIRSLKVNGLGLVCHLHFSDNRGRLDDHLAVGQGTIDFAGLVQRLKAVGYDDTITLEVFDKNRNLLVQSRERIKGIFYRPD